MKEARRDMVVILTALDLEYLAVRTHLTDVHAHVHTAGTHFEVGTLGNYRVALAVVGKGTHPAAALAERAIAEFDPAAVLFVGIAGALHDHVALGDIVVATHVYGYHGGTSEDDEFRARPRVWEAPHSVEQLARHVARTGSWTRMLPASRATNAPIVHFAPIAAGEVVLQSRTSQHAEWIRLHYNDAAAIEMEGAGAAQAGHLSSRPTLLIRGISDTASRDKTVTDRAGWQAKAAAHAAAFAITLATQLLAGAPAQRQPGQPPRSAGVEAFQPRPDAPESNTEKEADMAPTFRNIAKGHARVGMQVGQSLGSVHIDMNDTDGASLATRLEDLREAVRKAHRTGQLDADTFTAAETELSEAATCLPASDRKSRSRLTLALRRLKGLLEGTTDLAARIALVLSAIDGAP